MGFGINYINFLYSLLTETFINNSGLGFFLHDQCKSQRLKITWAATLPLLMWYNFNFCSVL